MYLSIYLSIYICSVLSRSVVSDSLQPHSSAHRDSPGKNTGVGCHSPFSSPGIFPTQGLNPVCHIQVDSLPSEPPGKPYIYTYIQCISEKAMAPHSSTLAWKIPWTEEPGRLQSMGLLESDTTERLHFHLSLSCFGEGNGNLLQCSCLENPSDGGAWRAAVYGVAQSRT